MEIRKVLLIILDGWGIGDGSEADAIAYASTPFIDGLKQGPHAKLLCAGEDVGLPHGQMGNSEVGHLNIGAGRVVYQDLVRINKAIRENTIQDNAVLNETFRKASLENKTIHFIGLVSDGGVHSMTAHLVKLCELATEKGVQKLFIHACTDGRDTDPHSGLGYVETLLHDIKNTNAKIATLTGRYYTMDRDKRWERVKRGYDLMVHGTGKKHTDILSAMRESYDAGVTDEFIEPIVITDNNDLPLAKIQEGDVVICFNYRTDRLREITTVLTQKDFPEFEMKTIPLEYLTMTRYDESFQHVKVIFDHTDLHNTLGEVIAQHGLQQIRIAETEKYPHVTFFFSGGSETEFKGEKRILVPSPKVATYDMKPSMSAVEVTDKLIPELEKEEASFICLNFANADMVGHTGIYPAIIEALETIDKCVERVITTAVAHNYSVLLTADHGNADFVENADESPNTAHSTNPVPIYLCDPRFKSIQNGRLCDIAPTVLTMMGLAIPEEMTGESLVH
ncbi:MAG: 2,3-bisphosphoglycerate-independent phosphoglycerate mutase [Bacteroidota bacterium]